SESNCLCSILLLDEDGRHLRHAAAPSLPAEYMAAIDGREIGPRVGSCGTAAHYGHAIVVTDIETDPLWADFSEFALQHGLRACWTPPSPPKDGPARGPRARTYRDPRGPNDLDREIVKLSASTAAVILDTARLRAGLQALNDRPRLAADVCGL